MRLRVDEFFALDIVHLDSEVDIESCGRPGASDLSFGTTQWAGRGAGRENVSFAWDWLYDRHARRIEAQWSTLRSDVRLIDVSGADLGEQGLRLCVAFHMTRVRWEWVVAGALGLMLALPRPDA